MTNIERFLDKIQKPILNDECWIWTAATVPKGYGVFYWNGKQGYAHRFSYEYYFGVFDLSLCVCHRCDIPMCVNPNHLFLGTLQDNNLDMYNKGRDNKAKGSEYITAKLDELKVDEMLIEIKNGLFNSIQDVSNCYNMSRSLIGKILNRQNWKHVTEKYSDQELQYIKDKIVPKTKSLQNSRYLNEEQVKQIKIKLLNNETPTNIAKLFQVDRSLIYQIKYNKIWKHVQL